MEQQQFSSYQDAKDYAGKMKLQGYRARIKPRSNMWIVLLRTKGEKYPTEIMAQGTTTTAEQAAGMAPPEGSSSVAGTGIGGSFQEKMYVEPKMELERVDAGMQRETVGARPPTPASVVEPYYGMRSPIPRAEALMMRTPPDLSRLKGKMPNMSMLTKMPYLRSRPSWADRAEGQEQPEQPVAQSPTEEEYSG